MSHFTVLVVTPERPTEETITKALQPYHEFECTGIDDEYVIDQDITDEVKERMKNDNETTVEALGYWGLEDKIVEYEAMVNRKESHKYRYAVVKDGQLVKAVNRTNPNKKWDWWTIGGRWNGYLKLKICNASRHPIKGNKSIFDKDYCQIDRFDGAMKSDIDFDGIRAEAEAKASEDYNKVRAVIDPHIEGFITWPKVRDEKFPGNFEAARDFYNNQPLMTALKEQQLTSFFFDPGKYLCTHDEFVKRAGDNAFCTFAFLRDGHWAEKGEMGWFAIVTDEKTDWPEQFAKLLADVPENHWLTVVDCHI